jgi:ACS family hexuronate transporter-like MFS transporter
MPINARFRWVIIGMIAVASLLNYIDRQALALMAGPVQRDMQMDDIGYANLISAFLVAYTIGGLIAAWIVDRIGPRWGLALFVGWWSIASAGTGIAQNIFQMGASRFALGLGEIGNWVAAPKLVREWFPERERALAIGIYSAAAHAGATISPALITLLMMTLGWRMAFVATGVIGLLWVAIWLVAYRKDRPLPVYETDSAQQADPSAEPVDGGGWAGWRAVLRTRAVWAIAAANSLTNPVFFFYLFWFPKYLTEERGVSTVQMASTAWIVYAAAGIGALLGGVASGALVQRGVAAVRARLWVMGAVAVTATIGAFNALEPSVAVSLALGALVAFCHTAWVTNQTALPVDLFPARHLGKVMGICGMLTGTVTIGSTYLIGYLVASLTYRPMFLVIAVAYPLGLVAALFAATGKPFREDGTAEAGAIRA